MGATPLLRNPPNMGTHVLTPRSRTSSVSANFGLFLFFMTKFCDGSAHMFLREADVRPVFAVCKDMVRQIHVTVAAVACLAHGSLVDL